MHRALFVAHEDMLNIVLLEHLVINREHRASGIAKDDVHALILEGLNHHFRSGHLTCHVLCSVYDITSFRIKKPPV